LYIDRREGENISSFDTAHKDRQTGRIATEYTPWGKKTAPLYFCNNWNIMQRNNNRTYVLQ